MEKWYELMTLNRDYFKAKVDAKEQRQMEAKAKAKAAAEKAKALQKK